MKYFSLYFLLVNLLLLGAQSRTNISYASYPDFFELDDDKIVFRRENRDQSITILNTGKYLIKTEDKIPFLYIDYDNGDNDRLLILKNEDICALFDKNDLIFWGTSGGLNKREGFLPPTKINATSFLSEKGIHYLPDNLTKYPKLGILWVEGAEGQGIGEKLFIQNTKASALHISIGFVSYDKPYLYTMNSRPREISLVVDGKFSIRYQLQDTPAYQKIIFPKELNYSDTLMIEILSVYEGTRYQDTCINNIIMQMF
jgi:hypothetical protein